MGTHQADQTDQRLYPFSEAELRRLAVYRTAIAAGFYTDACAAAARGDEDEFSLSWLVAERVEG